MSRCVVLDLLGISREAFLRSIELHQPFVGEYSADICDLDFNRFVEVVSASVFAVDFIKTTSGDLPQAPPLTNGIIDTHSLWAKYAAGHTIVVNAMERFDIQLAHISRLIALSLGYRINVNAYLTPPSSCGFPTHFDTHDVVLIQMHGRKSWVIYQRPLGVPELPIARNYNVDVESLQKEVQLEKTLHLGQSMYIPRGHPHRAETEHGASSLHLTFGLTPVTPTDILRIAVDLMSNTEVSFRQHLTHDLFSANPDGTEEALLGLLRNVGKDNAAFRDALAATRRSILGNLPPQLRPLFSDDKDHVAQVQRVDWRSDVYFETELISANRTLFKTPNKVVAFSLAQMKVVEVIRQRKSITTAELDHLGHSKWPGVIESLSLVGLVSVF